MNINFAGAHLAGAPTQQHRNTRLVVNLDGKDLEEYNRLYPDEFAIRKGVISLDASPDAHLLMITHGQHENFPKSDAEVRFVKKVLDQLGLDADTRAKFHEALKGFRP